jgi:hypothetical protein
MVPMCMLILVYPPLALVHVCLHWFPPCPYAFSLACSSCSWLGNCTGNPWVPLAAPVPVPVKNPYPHHGYGFLHGSVFWDPYQTRTRTRGG